MRAPDSIGEFIKMLEEAGELRRISAEVSHHLEIAAASDLEMKSPGGGKALLFEKVTGHSMPVLVNSMGSRKRLAMALGGDAEFHAARIDDLLKTAPPKGLGGFLKMLPKLASLRSVLPKRKKSGSAPCQEVIYRGDAVDLTKIPVLFCWPDDGGPFVTLPCVVTKDPESGRQNVGMYRLQIYDKNTTGMHWHIHKDGSASHDEYKRLGKRMEVAVAIGADPAITYAATAPLPRAIDEFMFAGFLKQRPVDLVKCKTVDLWVPAEAEIILEGYVDPGETRIEGPFGDHTGYYSPADPYPVFHVTAVTTRKNPVYFATVVGIPPMEDEWLGWATEKLFLPLLRTNWPEVEKMHLPVEGVFHNFCFAGMKKLYPMQARRLMSGFWGAGQMSFTKTICVMDENDPLGDPVACAEMALNRLRIPEDVVISEGVTDALDHSSPFPLWGGKLGLDATTKMEGEPGFGEPLAKTAKTGPQEILKSLQGEFPSLKRVEIPFPEARLGLAVLVMQKERPGEGLKLARAALALSGVDIAVAVEGVEKEALRTIVWRILSSIDAKRDILIEGGKMAVDATAKRTPEEGHFREWPKEVSQPEEVLRKARSVLEKG